MRLPRYLAPTQTQSHFHEMFVFVRLRDYSFQELLPTILCFSEVKQQLIR